MLGACDVERPCLAAHGLECLRQSGLGNTLSKNILDSPLLPNLPAEKLQHLDLSDARDLQVVATFWQAKQHRRHQQIDVYLGMSIDAVGLNMKHQLRQRAQGSHAGAELADLQNAWARESEQVLLPATKNICIYIYISRLLAQSPQATGNIAPIWTVGQECRPPPYRRCKRMGSPHLGNWPSWWDSRGKSFQTQPGMRGAERMASAADLASLRRLLFEAQTLALAQMRMQITEPDSASKESEGQPASARPSRAYALKAHWSPAGNCWMRHVIRKALVS